MYRENQAEKKDVIMSVLAISKYPGYKNLDVYWNKASVCRRGESGLPAPIRYPGRWGEWVADTDRHLLADLKSEHDQLIERVHRLEIKLKDWHASSEQSQRLEGVPGIDVLTATVLAATVTDGKGFRNGWQLADYLGLVPRQASSGGKDRLLGSASEGMATCVAF